MYQLLGYLLLFLSTDGELSWQGNSPFTAEHKQELLSPRFQTGVCDDSIRAELLEAGNW